jgi:hypothetical protein
LGFGFGVQENFKSLGQVTQRKLMGDEGLKLHSTTPYEFQGNLKVPAIPAAATDLDFSLDKKVDGKV